MNRFLRYIFPIVFLASCSEEVMVTLVPEGAVELTGVEAIVAENTETRAAALDKYNYVGRSTFVNNDKMVLTSIKRTVQPINGFTYSDIVYIQAIEQGQTSGGWNRDLNEGYSLDENGSQSSSHPERIYWSDAANGHTYIGYSVPLQASGESFDWEVKNATYEGSGSSGIPVYYGSIGNPLLLQTDVNNVISNFIDYTNNVDDEEVIDNPLDLTHSTKSYKSGNEKIKRDDLLLTYDINKVAETGGSVAKLYYHHALALVRVVVNIQGFSASTDAEDSKSVVNAMVLKDMLTMYKWRQMSYEAEALDETFDAANITAIYGSGSGVTFDQKKDVHMWIPRPAGTGTGVGKQFTFYGLAVPCSMGVDGASSDTDKAKNLHFEFKVKYPNPMSPTVDVEKTYKAMMPNHVEFKAGKCTTINISLNHSNEQMTVGAEYMDWQLVETPDEGELKKDPNFLESSASDVVTIADNPSATADDATWLYKNAQNTIVDIYDNDGSKEHPYLICNANQLLSFAYEVQSGNSFENKYVKLEADIILQPTQTASSVNWVGVGDDTHAFNGTFLGEGRNISRLKNKAFFANLGSSAVVEHLALIDVIDIGSSTGALADVNNGKIVACKVVGDVISTNSSEVGAIVGYNEGDIEVCYHIGKTESAGSVAGIAGSNTSTGTIVACYNAGAITGSSGTCYGIAANNSGTIKNCYYDNTLTGVENVAPTPSSGVENSSGQTTSQMQKASFVSLLNGALPSTSKYGYHFAPTMYPSIGDYVDDDNLALPEGFYRVVNYGTGRYVYVTDGSGHYHSSSDQDLGAIVLKKDLSNAISDPASIIYVKQYTSTGEYDLISQGVSIKTLTGHYAVIYPTQGHYRVGASEGLNTYLVDGTTSDSSEGFVSTQPKGDVNALFWDATPVSSTTDNYFGLSSEISVGDKFYVPFYAGFGFSTASEDMKVFYVSGLNESDGKACLREITGTIPANTPVIVACSSTAATDNRLTLKNDNSAFVSKNFLVGNMFNNASRNRTSYNSSTMRVLAVEGGKLAFVKKNGLEYLPANTSYLVVSEGAPDVIYAETEESYNFSGSSSSTITAGYYHVMNVGSDRYLSIIDDQVSISVHDVNVSHDLGALALGELNSSYPGSIIYVTTDGDITSQGVRLKSKINDFTINQRDDYYRIGATKNGLSRYICDNNGKVDTRGGSILWDLKPVNGGEHSLSLNSSISVTNDGNTINYVPFYAEFGFVIPSGMDVYYVDQIDLSNSENPKVVLKKLSGTIPNMTPVIIACSGSGSIIPTFSNSPLVAENKLSGNMFNTEPNSEGHHGNRKPVTDNMRVLGVDNDGKLVFQKATAGTYLPANSSYLQGDNLPVVLTVEFETQP